MHSTDSENTAIPQCEIKTTKVPKKKLSKTTNRQIAISPLLTLLLALYVSIPIPANSRISARMNIKHCPQEPWAWHLRLLKTWHSTGTTNTPFIITIRRPGWIFRSSSTTMAKKQRPKTSSEEENKPCHKMDKQIKCNIRGIGDGVEGGIINLRSTVKAFYTLILKILLPKWPVKKKQLIGY